MQEANYLQRVMFGMLIMSHPSFWRFGFIFAPFVPLTVLFGAFAPPEGVKEAIISLIASTLSTALVGIITYAALIVWIFS